MRLSGCIHIYFFRNSCKARFVSSSGSDGKTGNKNVLKSDVARFTSHVWTCLATNSIGSWSSVNTDSWLDKITRESRHTRQLRHFLQNKLTWNYSLPSVIAFPNLQPVADPGEGSGGPGPPLSKGLDDRLPPLSKGLGCSTGNNLICCQTGLNVGGKKAQRRLILPQCCKTSCTFSFPV